MHALDKGTLKHFLDSEEPEDWEKAAGLLLQVTAVIWRESGDGARSNGYLSNGLHQSRNVN